MVRAARSALWGASLGGIALLLFSLLVAPTPPWIALLVLPAYLGLLIAGVLFPQLEMYGDVVWSGTFGVALTFDDGPDPESTRRVLKILAEHGHTATFFVVGRKVDRHPDVLREIHAGGHAIGLHGYLHDRLFALKPPGFVRTDIERTQRAVEEACGVRPTLFRPPVGLVSPRTAAGARSAGVTLVAWSVRAFDGVARTSPEQIVQRIGRGLKPGAIVLLHDAAERDDHLPRSADALPAILDLIDKRGLTTLRVETFIKAGTASPARGK